MAIPAGIGRRRGAKVAAASRRCSGRTPSTSPSPSKIEGAAPSTEIYLGTSPHYRYDPIQRGATTSFTAIYQQVPEGYIAFVEELLGANTQGATLDEARENLKEAIAMVLDANRTLSEESLQGQSVIRETIELPA